MNGYATSTCKPFLLDFKVFGNSLSCLPVRIGIRAAGVPSPTILYPERMFDFKDFIKYSVDLGSCSNHLVLETESRPMNIMFIGWRTGGTLNFSRFLNILAKKPFLKLEFYNYIK